MRQTSNDLTELLGGPTRTVAAAAKTGRLAGLGLAAKLAVGGSLAAASVVGAGAAGMLPASATEAVRGAIETVTPVQFSHSDDDHSPTSSFGRRVSADATGESDGVKGVDGPTIASEAPGAANRPDSAAPDEPPGQSGVTGLARANETPAAPHAPDTAPSTVPDQATSGDHSSDQGGAPASVPSTIPTRGGTAGQSTPTGD